MNRDHQVREIMDMEDLPWIKSRMRFTWEPLLNANMETEIDVTNSQPKGESTNITELDSFQIIDEENSGPGNEPEPRGIMHVMSKEEACRGTVNDTSNVWVCSARLQ